MAISHTLTLARLRSEALLEPLREAQAYIRAHPDQPLVPTPSPEQRELEARILKALRSLFQTDRREYSGQDRLVPLGIDAGRNHLTLTVAQRQLASDLCALFPAWDRDGDFAEGIPRLRARAHADSTGVTLFCLGGDVEVTFVGLSLSELEAERERYLRNEGLVGARPRDSMLAGEFDVHLPDRPEFIALSAVVRRLGVFLSANPFAVDVWITAGTLHLELVVPADEPLPLPKLLERLQSPHFEPRLTLVRVLDIHHYLAIEGSTVEVNVRTHVRSSAGSCRTLFGHAGVAQI